MGNNENLTHDEHVEKLEIILIERAKCNCNLPNNRTKCRCFSAENLFILAQFYLDTNRTKKAFQIFDTIKYEHKPSMYQLGVILYDDLLDSEESALLFSDTESDKNDDTHNETKESFLSSEEAVNNMQKGK